MLRESCAPESYCRNLFDGSVLANSSGIVNLVLFYGMCGKLGLGHLGRGQLGRGHLGREHLGRGHLGLVHLGPGL